MYHKRTIREMKLSNKSKVSTALILCVFAGMMLHPNNTIVTNMLAFIPCIAACYIIAPLIKNEKKIALIVKNEKKCTIETKYKIGDEAWAMYNNHPFKCEIDRVIIIQDDCELSIQYRVVGCKYFFESELFLTKEELLKSL